MFEYGGIQIAFNERNAQFSAKFDGKLLNSTSLAGVKKKIDAIKQLKVGSFDALVQANWSNEVKRVSIVGIAKTNGRAARFAKDKWKDTNGGEHFKAFKDTPENEAAIHAAIDLDKRQNEEREALRAKHDEIHDAAWAAIAIHEFPK